MSFFMELVKKMGWKVVIDKTVDNETDSVNEDEAVERLYGSVQLPADFDYKKELEQAIKQKME